jgi:hypothetical protein
METIHKCLKWVFGGLRGMAATGLCTGTFIVAVGMTPGQYFAYIWHHPWPWLFDWEGRVGLIVVGLLIIGWSLHLQRKPSRLGALSTQASGLVVNPKLPSIWNSAIFPSLRYICLSDGAARLYGKLRGTHLGAVIEERAKSSVTETLNYAGNLLAHHAPLEVRKAPSPDWEPFDKNHLSTMTVCSGGSAFRTLGGNKTVYFTEVRLQRSDLKKAIETIRNASDDTGILGK